MHRFMVAIVACLFASVAIQAAHRQPSGGGYGAPQQPSFAPQRPMSGQHPQPMAQALQQAAQVRQIEQPKPSGWERFKTAVTNPGQTVKNIWYGKTTKPVESLEIARPIAGTSAGVRASQTGLAATYVQPSDATKAPGLRDKLLSPFQSASRGIQNVGYKIQEQRAVRALPEDQRRAYQTMKKEGAGFAQETGAQDPRAVAQQQRAAFREGRVGELVQQRAGQQQFGYAEPTRPQPQQAPQGLLQRARESVREAAENVGVGAAQRVAPTQTQPATPPLPAGVQTQTREQYEARVAAENAAFRARQAEQSAPTVGVRPGYETRPLPSPAPRISEPLVGEEALRPASSNFGPSAGTPPARPARTITAPQAFEDAGQPVSGQPTRPLPLNPQQREVGQTFGDQSSGVPPALPPRRSVIVNPDLPNQ